MRGRRTPTGWAAEAPAKINVFLRLLRKRPDGFHDLETVMVRISLADTLFGAACDGADLRLTVVRGDSPGLIVPEIPPAQNLVLKAAHLFRDETGCQRGAVLTLVKRIPSAAGLGGGSSDAAAALWMLNELWQTGLSRGDLQELAARLGSDVPFFLADSAWALCTGRGEILEPFSSPVQWPLVLARPTDGLATADVYRTCRPGRSSQAVDELVAALRQGAGDHAAHLLLNDLQESAERNLAELQDLRRAFDRLGLVSHQLTGSGSAYFGIARQAREARQAEGRLQGRRWPWTTVAMAGA